MQFKPLLRVMTVLVLSMGMLDVVVIAAPISPVHGNGLTIINTTYLNQYSASPPFISPMQVGITDTASTTPTTTLTETAVLTSSTTPTTALVITPTSTITNPTPTATSTSEPTTPTSPPPSPTETEVVAKPSPTPEDEQHSIISDFMRLVQTKPWIPLGFLLVILLTALTMILVTAQKKTRVVLSPPRESGGTAPLPPKPTPVQERAFLKLKLHPEMTFPLFIDEITIGRALDNSIVIPPGVQGAETVSHYHARLYRIERWILEDLDSTNGTYVNGQRTGRNYLRNGWEIGIGGVIFVFHTGKVEV